MLFGFNVSTPSLYPMHRLFSSLVMGVFFSAKEKISGALVWAIVLLVIREMESFVVSAAAKRWIGKICYTVVSPIYTFFCP